MDRDTLGELITAHQAEVYRYVRYLGADAESTEDLVQETFLAAFRADNVPDVSDVQGRAAWLRGIARNHFLMHCRRRRNSLVKVDSETLARAEGVWASEFLRNGDGFETMEALKDCVEALPEKQRALVKLQYAERKSRSEMAAMYRMTEDGIKSLMRRVRVGLAECIEKRLGAAQA